MKFYGTPGMALIDRKTHKGLGSFDDDGILETDNEKLIAKLKQHFKFEEVDNKCEQVEEQIDKEKKLHKCKICTFETDNKGLLLQHYKNHHKKV